MFRAVTRHRRYLYAGLAMFLTVASSQGLMTPNVHAQASNAAVVRPSGSGRVEPVHHSSRWLASWAAASSGAVNLPGQDYTFRNVVHIDSGGTELRVRLTNKFGTAPLTVGGATVAVPDGPVRASVEPGTLQALTYAGSPTIILAAGQAMWSDPVELTVASDSDVLISVFVPGNSTGYTIHRFATQTSFFSTGADQSRNNSATAFPSQTPTWFLINGVDVREKGTRIQGVVVAFGDSITDGMGSTPDANDRYPDILARRLLTRPKGRRLTVVNAGIGGNKLLTDGGLGGPSGISRFRSDALSVSGVRAVIVMEGVNDINQGATAQQLIAGYERIIDEAKARRIELVGATLTPFNFTGSREQVRETVNKWILTSGTFAHVIDLSAVVADPDHPSRLLPQFASTLPLPADPRHPNDAGYAAMAAAISSGVPLDLGRGQPGRPSRSAQRFTTVVARGH